jgi:hypothetical protein
MIVLLIPLNLDVRANTILRVLTFNSGNTKRKHLLQIKLVLNIDGISLQRLCNTLI